MNEWNDGNDHGHRDARSVSIITFHDDSLACLTTALDILQHLDVNHVMFKLSHDSMEFFAKERNGHVFVQCLMPSTTFKQYLIRDDITMVLDARNLFQIIGDDRGRPVPEITFEARGTRVQTIAGAMVHHLDMIPAAESCIDDHLMPVFPCEETAGDDREKRCCMFDLKAELLDKLIDGVNESHAKKIIHKFLNDAGNEEPVPFIVPKLLFHTRTTPFELGLALNYHDSKEPVAELDFATMFRGPCTDVVLHHSRGDVLVQHDMRYFLFLPKIDFPEDYLTSTSMFPFTFHVRQGKPCQLHLSLGKTVLNYVVAPVIHENDDDDARDLEWLYGDGGDHATLQDKPVLAFRYDAACYQVPRKEFLEHVEQYVDMNAWRVKFIEGAKHLVSAKPVLARMPQVRSSISLVDGSFAFHDKDTSKKFQPASCRRLVSSDGNQHVPLDHLPFVLRVLAMASTFQDRDLVAFCPRIVIDAIHGSSKRDRLATVVLDGLVDQFLASNDKYKRLYYMVHLMYLFIQIARYRELGEYFLFYESIDTPHDFIKPADTTLRNWVYQTFPALLTNDLAEYLSLDPFLFLSTFARYLKIKENLDEFIEIEVKNEYFPFVSLHDMMVQAIIVYLEINVGNKKNVDEMFSAPLLGLDPPRTNHVAGILLSLYYKLHYVISFLANMVIDRDARVNVLNQEFNIVPQARVEWMEHHDSFQEEQARIMCSLVQSLEEFIDAFESMYRFTLVYHIMGKIPVVVIPFTCLLERVTTIDDGNYPHGVKSVLKRIRTVLTRLTGTTIARIIDPRCDGVLVPFLRTLVEWTCMHPGLSLPEHEIHVLLELEAIVGEFIPVEVDGPFTGGFGCTIASGHVTSLEVRRKKLSRVPESIGELRHLKRLRLDENDLCFLPASMGFLPGLSELGVGTNGLRDLPYSFVELNHVETLDLSGNQFEHVPRCTRKMHGLKYLLIASNKLVALPEHVYDYKRLEELDASSNHIKFLHDRIGELKKLRSLNLASNEIDQIPEDIGFLRELRHFLVGGNKLDDLPVSLVNLEHLEELDIHDTPLERVHPALDAWLDELTKKGGTIRR